MTAATTSRFMPPWKPESGFGTFVGERRLTDEEIGILSEWVESGAAEGDPTELPAVPSWPEGWRLGRPDLVVEMPDLFLLPAGGPDIFRTFVLPLPVQTAVYVKGFELQPGDTRAIHHANLLLDTTRGSRSLDEADPRPGYEGVTAFSADFPDGHFLGWTPGQLAPPEPDGMAWPLRPGTDLVLQLHLRPTGRIERVQPKVAFFFTDQPPMLTPTLLRLSRQGIDIAPGEKRFELEDSYLLPVDIEIHRIQPHAHYLARRIEAWAELPDKTVTWLIRIPDWDFNWQDSYRYATPVLLPKGTRLAMRYSYDNSNDNPRNPNQPPRRVRYGQRSTDEMAELYLEVVTRPQDREVLIRDYRPKEVREFIVGFEMMLDADPDNAALHSDLGSLYFEAGDVLKAVHHFTETLRTSPRSALAHNNLGAALQAMGQLDAALSQYQQALEIQPDHPVSHYNVGLIHELRGEMHEAARYFRIAFTEESLRPVILIKLAWILATSSDLSLRDPEQALRLAAEAAALTEHRDSTALDVLAAAYASLGRFDEAIGAAEAALAGSSSAQARAAIRARLELYRARRPFVVPPPQR